MKVLILAAVPLGIFAVAVAVVWWSCRMAPAVKPAGVGVWFGHTYVTIRCDARGFGEAMARASAAVVEFEAARRRADAVFRSSAEDIARFASTYGGDE